MRIKQTHNIDVTHANETVQSLAAQFWRHFGWMVKGEGMFIPAGTRHSPGHSTY